MSSHEGHLELGRALGPEVFWAVCECGWIGLARSEEAPAWDDHRAHKVRAL